jgi:hypothetical protein
MVGLEAPVLRAATIGIQRGGGGGGRRRLGSSAWWVRWRGRSDMPMEEMKQQADGRDDDGMRMDNRGGFKRKR